MTLLREEKGAPVIRLSLMMFLEFFVLGATMPIISLYLKNNLGFSGTRIGIIMACSAFSSIISPFIGAVIADRLISAERLLSLFHLLGALLLACLYQSTHYLPVLLFYLFYWLLIGPTTALTTAIAFHHAPHAVKQFGGIRLWGTLGWIGAAWTYRFFFSGASGDLRNALLMGMFGSLLLALFSFSIPAAVSREKKPAMLFPVESLRIFLRSKMVLFVFCAIFVAIADRMYMYGGAPYLKSLGFAEKNIMPVLSVGQFPEIIGLALLGVLIARAGIKKVLLLGIFLEIVRFVLFSCNANGIMLYFTISLHGLTYAFFFVTAAIFLDKNCSPSTRSGAHQYFSLMVGGTSNLAGNVLAGFVFENLQHPVSGSTTFTFFWMVPLLLSIAGFAGIFFFFREPEAITKEGTLSI